MLRCCSLLFLALALLVPAAAANVVRPAPEVTWLSSGGQTQTLRSLRGQPVVLIVARSPVQRTFRAQVRQLQRVYGLLGNARTVMVAAFTEQPGVIRSNIPFVQATRPEVVAASYGVDGPFAVFVIGRDGNIDALSDRVLSGQRILDIINNSFVVQSNNRRSQ
jgi:hypothetical protein